MADGALEQGPTNNLAQVRQAIEHAIPRLRHLRVFHQQ
jgi:hypothetical protein